MEVCVWDRTTDVQFSACFLSALCISNSHPGIISQILSSLCCLRPYTTRAKHLVLLGCYLERKQTLLHCSVMPVLTLAILLWRSKWDSDFLFPLAFILPQCYMCDFSGIKKADECAKTAAYRAAVLRNGMPNLFFKHPERLFFYCLPRETVPLPICFL